MAFSYSLSFPSRHTSSSMPFSFKLHLFFHFLYACHPFCSISLSVLCYMFGILVWNSPYLTCQMFDSHWDEKRGACLVKRHVLLAEHVAAAKTLYTTSMASVIVISPLVCLFLYLCGALHLSLYLALLADWSLWTHAVHSANCLCIMYQWAAAQTLCSWLALRFSLITLETPNCTTEDEY